ncbi:Lipid transfer protein [Zostera marina]|uniref:Non-specific lipid-transfer protein n=1 Tax=Zostera marina TaxID=29655 RepID=A0A0K9PVC2_ZOSMR|nr:Lipid transfer protein [Zostera marina]
MTSRFIPFLLIALLFVTASIPVQSLNCGDVMSSVVSCKNYVRGKEKIPPNSCCSGLKSLQKKANNTADRRRTCKCFQKLANSMVDFKERKANELPKKCGVKSSYKISKSTNCNTVH